MAADTTSPVRRFGLRSLIAAALGCTVSLQAAPARAQYVGQVSSFVMDAQTGQVLQQYNPDLQRYPASLTKLMTLYLAFQSLRANRINLDQAVPVSLHASSMEPSKLGLVPGTYVTVEQAILALVTKSANDAACALGEMMGGGDERRFAQVMTQQARLLGMSNTTFRNASGLPDPEQVSTARDFAILARSLIRDFPEQYHYFSVPAFMFHGRYIGNHDPMLRSYPGADGLKTGYTADAGHNLVSSAVRGNVRLIGVILGARSNPQRSAMMTNILDAGFQREGVPIEARPAVRPLATGMTLVSADSAPRGWLGRHGRRHAGRTRLATHLTIFRRGHGLHALHLARYTLVGARVHLAGAHFRRGPGHGRHAARLRLTDARPGGHVADLADG
ncbi:D-alanyl-D-alanine carboxypeptidase family protein [Lichenicoccus roseus]|uniref:D-alanyl-D-alanine carboxypeptidase n=1 Tax=Lichenicoccus roseus TaxID=2683649 RepID=A0A5R9JF81_9PROT|nr:D-alanyl-D-alanine carboxypeptidase family protein [Lichenicoccus roseus]TLU74301.1 D-alanyl-D-alanine carboxypeptidase [Lichenicoccus roseus]